MSFLSTQLSGSSAAGSPVAKNVVLNNGSATVTCVAGLNAYLGTNPTSVAFTFPAVAGLSDSTVVTVMTQAAVSVAATWASTGGTFIGAPSTLTALQSVKFIFHSATLQWIAAIV